jgi:hypothetical protein
MNIISNAGDSGATDLGQQLMQASKGRKTSTLTIEISADVCTLHRIVIDAGIAYWVADFRWIDEKGCAFVINKKPDAEDPIASAPIRVTPDALCLGIQRMLAGKCRLDIKMALLSTLLERHLHGDQGRWICDAETGDCLIQFAALGKLVYG